MSDITTEEQHLINVIVFDHDDQPHHLELPDGIGLNMMEACKASGLPIEGICGGMALCGTCHAYILSDHQLSPPSPDEEAMLDQLFHVDERSRLCCQLKVTPGIQNLVLKLAPL